MAAAPFGNEDRAALIYFGNGAALLVPGGAESRAAIDRTLDKLRGKYGYFCIRRGITLVNPALDLDAREEHLIHPIGFLGTLHE